MSDNGSNVEKLSDNGSNVSIEEIGPDEIEEIGEIKDKPETGAEANSKEDSNEPAAAAAAVPAAEDSGDPPLDTLSPAKNTADEPAAVEPPAEPSVPTPPEEQVATAVAPSPAPAGGDKSDAKVAEAPAAAAAAAGGQAVEVIEEVPRPAQADPPVQKQQKQEIARRMDDDDDEDDDDIDETLTERLIGLTEMFPECVRNGSVSLVSGSWAATKSMYGFSRSAAWIFFSTASILFMPVIIETERMSIMDQQKQQKTQMLLGPGVASSGAPSLGPPPI